MTTADKVSKALNLASVDDLEVNVATARRDFLRDSFARATRNECHGETIYTFADGSCVASSCGVWDTAHPCGCWIEGGHSAACDQRTSDALAEVA